jgi:hypothetical protein
MRNSHIRLSRIARRVEAGWWQIKDVETGQIDWNQPDKAGQLINAIPGEDSTEELYNGDGPADVMGDALKKIDGMYQETWGRLPTMRELRGVSNFVLNGRERSGDYRASLIASRVAEDDVRTLIAYAVELKEELRHDKTAISLKPWKPMVKIIRKALIKAANKVYQKLVEPHLDEIYDDEIEEDAEAWCKKEKVDPCDPPRDILQGIVDDVKEELEPVMARRYFVTAFIKAAKTINPVNIVKTMYQAVKKHGLRVGMKVALIILIGDGIIPILGGWIHPSLFAILHASPHTEIALAALAVTEAIGKEEVLEWVQKYEQMTGDDLVKGKLI